MAEATAHLTSVAARPRHGIVVSERKLLLAGLDLVAVCAAFVVAFNVRTAPVRGVGFYVPRFGTVVAAAAWLLCAQVLGAYDLRMTRRLPDVFRVVGTTTAATMVVLLGFFFVVPYRITRPTLLAWLPLAAGGVLLGRLFYRRAFAGSHFASRIALVAGDDVLERVWPAVGSQIEGLYKVAAVVRPDDPEAGARLRDAIEHRQVSQVVLGVRDNVSRPLFAGLLRCHEDGARVRSLVDLYEELTGRMLLDQLGHTWLMALPMRAEASRLYRTGKRAVDILAACVGLLLLVVVVAIVVPATLVTDRGPIFHRQVRVGQYGRTFTLWKLRSMRHDPSAATEWTQEKDTRVTPVGRVLRALHLDELPQAWSILRGDMSLVGPRPEQPQYVAALREQIDFYSSRLTVRPGLTGWAQVNAGYCDGLDGARVKLSYDLYYVKRQSVSLDVLILARTVRAVLAMSGR